MVLTDRKNTASCHIHVAVTCLSMTWRTVTLKNRSSGTGTEWKEYCSTSDTLYGQVNAWSFQMSWFLSDLDHKIWFSLPPLLWWYVCKWHARVTALSSCDRLFQGHFGYKNGWSPKPTPCFGRDLWTSTIGSLIHGSLANQFFLLNYYTINCTAFSALQSALLQCVWRMNSLNKFHYRKEQWGEHIADFRIMKATLDFRLFWCD